MRVYNFAEITMLIAEGNAVLRRLYRELLASFGVGRVLAAASAAVPLLRRHGVDMAVTDLHLVPLDGCTLTRLIRRGAAVRRTETFTQMGGEGMP